MVYIRGYMDDETSTNNKTIKKNNSFKASAKWLTWLFIWEVFISSSSGMNYYEELIKYQDRFLNNQSLTWSFFSWVETAATIQFIYIHIPQSPSLDLIFIFLLKEVSEVIPHLYNKSPALFNHYRCVYLLLNWLVDF